MLQVSQACKLTFLHSSCITHTNTHLFTHTLLHAPTQTKVSMCMQTHVCPFVVHAHTHTHMDALLQTHEIKCNFFLCFHGPVQLENVSSANHTLTLQVHCRLNKIHTDLTVKSAQYIILKALMIWHQNSQIPYFQQKST